MYCTYFLPQISLMWFAIIVTAPIQSFHFARLLCSDREEIPTFSIHTTCDTPFWKEFQFALPKLQKCGVLLRKVDRYFGPVYLRFATE